MENEIENVDSTNDTEKTENQFEETVEQEDVSVLKKQIATLEAQKNHWKDKAEKAKSEPEKKVEPTKTETEILSPKDYLALTEQKVSVDDFDEVMRVSKILGKSVADTLKDKTMKSILSERIEERRSAEVIQTKGGQRGSAKVSDEQVISKALRGDLPDDDEGIRRLAEARLAERIKRSAK